MPKLNTRSRLELAHLKRQLDIQKRPIPAVLKNIGANANAIQRQSVAPPPTRPPVTTPAPPQPNKTSKSKTNDNSNKFDYKFVFTNSAMRTDDKMFDMKNPTLSTIERNLKTLVPTNSLLPYGVTIRNPHMFEEDQLAVIQRRQELLNATIPSAPYSSFREKHRALQRLEEIGQHNDDTNPNNKSTLTNILTHQSRPHHAPKDLLTNNKGVRGRSTTTKPKESKFQTEMKRKQELSILNRFSKKTTFQEENDKLPSVFAVPVPASASAKKASLLNPTNVRDTEFRQRYKALEAHHRIATNFDQTLNRDEDIGNSNSNPVLLEKDSSKELVDKLSNTVQDLNRYEDRLKHYLKSKNTMKYAGAALKQLRLKRSKTIMQLSKLAKPGPGSGPEPDLFPNRNGILKDFLNSQSAPPTHDFSSMATPNNQPQRERPRLTRPRPTDNHNTVPQESNKSYSVDSEYPPKKHRDVESLGPLKLSDFIGMKIASSRRHHGQEQGQGQGQRQVPVSVSRKDDDKKMTPLQEAIIDGVNLDKMSVLLHSRPLRTNRGLHNYVSKFEIPSPASHSVIPGLANNRESEVFRKVYQDYRIHEEKVQAEIMRDGRLRRGQNEKHKRDASSRRVAVLSQFLHNSLSSASPARKLKSRPIPI